MKTIIPLLLTATIAASTVEAATVRVSFTGNRPDTVVVNAEPIAEIAQGITSIAWKKYAVTADTLSIPIEDDEVMRVCLWPLDLESYNCYLYIAPGETADVAVDGIGFKKAKLSGTPFIDAINDWNSASEEFGNSDHYKSLSLDDKIMATYEFNMNYALAHRNEDIAVYAAMRMPVAMCGNIIDSIAPEAATGMLQPLYDGMRTNVERDRQLRSNRKAIESGGEAPDFTLTDIHGNKVSLSSFKGQWVLLDFWATWCRWCIEGFPELEEFAKEADGKCSVITISVDDHRSTWENYLSTHNLPWINLWNDPTDHTDSNPKTAYAVESLPTKLLIDPQGKVVKFSIGHNPSFLREARLLIHPR